MSALVACHLMSSTHPRTGLPKLWVVTSFKMEGQWNKVWEDHPIHWEEDVIDPGFGQGNRY